MIRISDSDFGDFPHFSPNLATWVCTGDTATLLSPESIMVLKMHFAFSISADIYPAARNCVTHEIGNNIRFYTGIAKSMRNAIHRVRLYPG